MPRPGLGVEDIGPLAFIEHGLQVFDDRNQLGEGRTEGQGRAHNRNRIGPGAARQFQAEQPAQGQAHHNDSGMLDPKTVILAMHRFNPVLEFQLRQFFGASAVAG